MDVEERDEGDYFETEVDEQENGPQHGSGEHFTTQGPPFSLTDMDSIGSFSENGKIFARRVGKESFRIIIFRGVEKLYIRGAADCRLLFGYAEVFGFPLDYEYRAVVSPYTTGLRSIETLENMTSVNLKGWYQHHEWSEEDKALGVPQFVDHLVTNGGDTVVNSITALVVIKNCAQMSLLGPVREEIIGKKNTKGAKVKDNPLLMHTCELATSVGLESQPVVSVPKWKALAHTEWLSSNPSPPITLVCGKKSVGKSTLMRYLVNVMLARHGKVVLLDLDLGQPELTAPGFVSISVLKKPLLGPSYANVHLSKPYWQESHFLGAVSANTHLSEITNVATMLYSNYKFSENPKFYLNHPLDHESAIETGSVGLRPPEPLGPHVHAPMIINTHGWVEGQGLLQLEHMVRVFAPNNVVQISVPSGNLRPLFSPLQFRDQGVSVHSVHSAAVHIGYHTIRSTEKRLLQLTSALGDLRQIYAVPWSALRIHLLDCEVAPSQIMYVLNGAVVALVVDNTKYENLSQNLAHSTLPEYQVLRDKNNEKSQDINPMLPSFLLEAPTYLNSRAVGIGIVSNIDMKNCRFYISTTLTPSEIAQVNTLVKGSIELPPAVLLAQAVPATPYLTADNLNAVGSGSAKLKVRTNLIRGNK